MTWRERLVALATAGLALEAFASACGDDGGGGVFVDGSRANSFAHAALFQPADLPGGTWESRRDDDFIEFGTKIDTPACRDINSRQTVITAKSDASRTGRAQRSMRLPMANGTESRVDVVIVVLKDSGAASALATDYATLVKSPSYQQCVGDALRAGAGNSADAKVDVNVVSAPGSVPAGGLSRAHQLAIALGDKNSKATLETYVWRRGNIDVISTVLGNEPSAALSRAVLEKTDANVQANAR